MSEGSRRAENYPVFHSFNSDVSARETSAPFYAAITYNSLLIVHFQMDDDEPPSSIWMTNEYTSRLGEKYPSHKNKAFLLLYQTSIGELMKSDDSRDKRERKSSPWDHIHFEK